MCLLSSTKDLLYGKVRHPFIVKKPAHSSFSTIDPPHCVIIYPCFCIRRLEPSKFFSTSPLPGFRIYKCQMKTRRWYSPQWRHRPNPSCYCKLVDLGDYYIFQIQPNPCPIGFNGLIWEQVNNLVRQDQDGATSVQLKALTTEQQSEYSYSTYHARR